MADDPKTPPQAAGDKPPSDAPAEPLKGEVSRTDAPGAGVSAAPAAAAKPGAPAPGAKPAAPVAAKPAAPAAAKPAADHVPKAAPPSGPTDPPPPADKPVPAFITALQAAKPGAVTLVSFWVGDCGIL